VIYCAQYSDFAAKKNLSMTAVAPVPYKILILNFWVALLANFLTTLGHCEGLVQPKNVISVIIYPPSCRTHLIHNIKYWNCGLSGYETNDNQYGATVGFQR